ncbi:MAG: aminoacyl-tRNA hydrolase [Pseudanabaenaceae cyanobacterium]
MTHNRINLLVGLGNPGTEYAQTRHNIGFMALDYLAQGWGITWKEERKFQGIYGRGELHLLKPTTYMNNSGIAVRKLMDWYKLHPQQILVIYDDLDLPLGKLRLRAEGSAGGHNGMKSLIAHLGTSNFPRLRLGIGRSSHGSVNSHVLGGFNPEEQKLLPSIFALMGELIHCALQEGIPKAMSLYNNRTIYDCLR